ncbi:MAG: VWA domain-containing protein [Planctomycetales bacterium]|nr:VWA domain-containing protein [Planctomycetales bacterium]
MWRWLLGIETAQDQIEGDLRFEWLSAPANDAAFLLIIGLILACVVVWLLYRWEASRLSPVIRAILAILRLAIVGAAIAMLCEPVVVLTKHVLIPSHLLVLVDTSESMNLRDAWKDSEEAAKVTKALGLADEISSVTRKDLVAKAFDNGLARHLAQTGDRIVHVHPFAEQLELNAIDVAVSPNDGGTAESSNDTINLSANSLNGRNTAIGSAIEQSSMAYRGMPISGVLIISDGQSNSGESTDGAVQNLKEKGIRINAVAVGTARGPSNASILKIDTNPIAFVRDTNSVSVLVQSRGMANSDANFIAEIRRDGEQWKEVSRQQVPLADDGSVHNVTFTYEEEKPGRVEIRVRLEIDDTELTVDDNLAMTEVQLIPQQLRVLFIAGSTFPEVQFIRNTLRRDKGVDISTWNQSAEEGYEHEGNNPIQRLPNTEKELNEYDCVILYDPDPEKWPSNFPELLDKFVSFSGGGLIYIAGEMQSEKSFQDQSSPQMSWISLLPVVRDPGLFRSEVKMKLSARNAWRLQITPAGRRDHVMTFAEDPTENQRILDSLPGMFWHFPITRAKAGATVLARHGDPRMRNEFGPEVLLATHRVGPGRVYFVGFDSTYRWRYLDEQTFDGFWARMVDRAGRTKQLGGGYPFRLRTDKLSYEPGDHVRLTAALIEQMEASRDIQSVQAEIEHADDPPLQLSLQPGAREGEFEVTFPVETPGPYMIRAWSGNRGTDSKVKTVTQQITVELPSAEYEKPTLDRGRLQAIASTTGGNVYELHELDRLAAGFDIGKIEKLQEDRNEIWNAPVFFGFILVAITAEWLIRKRYQLV